MGKEIGAVWSDFDFNESVGIEEVFHWRSDLKGGIKNEQPIFLVGEADLRSGGEHTFGFDAAHFCFANFESTGELGSGEAAGNFVADLVIGGSADDLAERAFTCVDRGDFEAVGVGVLNGFFNFGHNDLVALNSHFLEALDFDAGKGEEIADFVERAGAKIEAFFEPIERNVHEAGRRRRDGGFFNRKTWK